MGGWLKKAVLLSSSLSVVHALFVPFAHTDCAETKTLDCARFSGQLRHGLKANGAAAQLRRHIYQSNMLVVQVFIARTAIKYIAIAVFNL
jgi:hypothetical protein